MGKLSHTLRILLGTSLILGVGPLSAKAAPANSKKQPKEVAHVADTFETSIEASRYVGENIDKFVQGILPTLDMANRTTDPFGRLQDPEAKPVVPAALQNLTQPAEPPVPFADVVSAIQINTVMSAEKKFLVGSRTFTQGDQFPVNFRGKQIRIQIVEVSSRQIQFKNLESGEVAVQKLNLLPPGMRAGQDGITAPGMVPSGREAPLEIEPANSTPSGTPTR